MLTCRWLALNSKYNCGWCEKLILQIFCCTAKCGTNLNLDLMWHWTGAQLQGVTRGKVWASPTSGHFLSSSTLWVILITLFTGNSRQGILKATENTFLHMATSNLCKSSVNSTIHRYLFLFYYVEPLVYLITLQAKVIHFVMVFLCLCVT